MDIFGVSMLGLCTAVGGGVLRDLVLGNTPPLTFQDPVYALTAIAVSILTFLPCVQRAMERHPLLGEKLLGTMDAVGLGVFTVVGVQCAYARSEEYGVFLLVFVGVITGRRRRRSARRARGEYALCLRQAFLRLRLDHRRAADRPALGPLGADAAMLLGAAAVVVLRLCAAHWRWSLPKAKAKG